ncbi:cilia- and flagella-associated protein 300 [Aplysia californica]|uniref:Cilia- and flagella-associated protein 300 n=1 Tax=Aplysia californica TaxID=6500 RepID=A0ABM0JVM2_APLCA|nr:cilia- and flagella-associated protein 300 [Aplysia californica]
MADNDPKFSFMPLAKSFSSLDGKEVQELFMKWSMKGRLKAKMFTFDQCFQAYEKDKFGQDFFNNSEVVNALEVPSNSGKYNSLGTKASKVKVTSVPCSVLSMSFFDKLCEGEIARESGDVKKCFDEFIGDFTISDNLRQMLLNEDSDVFCEFNEKEREEFLFLLFSHICLGGRLCQYEDNIQPYLEVTKALYKDLISVQKDPETKALSILSHVFKVCCYDDHGDVFFPSSKLHPQNFAYLVVDPLKRTVICLSHVFGSCF